MRDSVTHQHGVKLEQSYYDVNQPEPGPGALQQRRRYLNYTNIQQQRNAAIRSTTAWRP